ncbi:MAG: di-trans,poly-cis-decaprenylcistransferase [Bacteroidetes bacterium RIFCSPLOWO2_02_FULL_36_8]|nr:MAG: di-trans,poly-cis-decaprenylcistransferase [Bacteroidetes bacterium RIFCSPLOWO2_02_FULL_36_8]OFY69888.1 MAG: di-trans,poly-cis-decaprenylcistransferase [Bacteroidetes bacterium RIFCSPLOWO2_12_FULL_37_12]
MENFKNQINKDKLPSHIAIIMDGNGRWAKKQGARRVFGHQHGVEAVRDTTEGAAEIGIKFLTVYAFSTENWVRPKYEINALMTLLVKTIRKETKTLMNNDIRLKAVGDLLSLPKECIRELNEAMTITQNNKRMVLNLALSYSGRWDILNAAKKLAQKYKEESLDLKKFSYEDFSKLLDTHWLPDPELLIRTSGEMRISNFLLWEIAYSEIYITEKLWPDFRREDLFQAIVNYQNRERRFGGI